MKLKHAITILVLGYCLDFLGSLQMILHAPNARVILIIATVIKIFGGILVLCKILTHPKAKEFLDW